MKKLLSIVFVLVLAFFVAPDVVAAENGAKAFLGKWKITMEFRGEEMTSMLSIRVKDDKSLTGKWETPRGASELKKVKIENGTLTFSRTMQRRDQEATVVSTAKIKDGKLVGKMQTQRGDRPFSGVHAKTGETLGRPRGHGGTEGAEGRPHGPRPEGGERGDRPHGGGQRGPEAMMERFDANQDGKLQEDEAPERMQQFFGTIDQNADGELDAEELKTMGQMREQRGPRN